MVNLDTFEIDELENVMNGVNHPQVGAYMWHRYLYLLGKYFGYDACDMPHHQQMCDNIYASLPSELRW